MHEKQLLHYLGDNFTTVCVILAPVHTVAWSALFVTINIHVMSCRKLTEQIKNGGYLVIEGSSELSSV
jgi:hypothetical protein